MDINRIVGKHIELARRERDWNQGTLAERLNVSQNAISRWESGQVSVTADNLWRLAALFNKSVEHFFSPLPLEETGKSLKKGSTARQGRKQAAPS